MSEVITRPDPPIDFGQARITVGRYEVNLQRSPANRWGYQAQAMTPRRSCLITGNDFETFQEAVDHISAISEAEPLDGWLPVQYASSEDVSRVIRRNDDGTWSVVTGGEKSPERYESARLAMESIVGDRA